MHLRLPLASHLDDRAGLGDPSKLCDVRVGSCVTSIAMSTVMRNCTRDEGGPFGFGNRVLISSHRKLLWSKAVVVSVAEKPKQEIPAGKVERGERKRTAAEVLRKRIRRCRNRGVTLLPGSAWGMS